MGLHQTPVPGLSRNGASAIVCSAHFAACRGSPERRLRVGEDAQRANADVGELAPLRPRPTLRLRPGRKGCRASDAASVAAVLRLLQIACRERLLRLLGRARRRDDVDPGSFGELEPVAAEGARQSASRRRRPASASRPRSLLTSTVSALSQVAGGASPQSASASSSRGTGSALLGDQVGEQQPALPPRKARLVDHDAVGLDCDPTCEENLQPDLLAFFLPAFCLDLGGAFLASPRGVVDKVHSVRLRVRGPRRGRGRARRRSPAPRARGARHGAHARRGAGARLSRRVGREHVGCDSSFDNA